MRTGRSGLLARTLLLACLATPAAGQVALIDPLPGYEVKSFRADTRVFNQFSTGVSGGGEFSRLRVDVAASGGGPLNRNIRLSLYAGYTYVGYDFATSPAPTCPDLAGCFEIPPWQRDHTVDIAPGLAVALADSLQVFAMVPLRWTGETDSDATAMTAGAIAGVRLALGDSFSGMLGIGVQSELAADASVFPVIGLEWRIADQLHLRTTGAPYQGGGAELVWGPSDAVQVELSAGYERERFRLSRDEPDANGVGEYTAAPIELGVRFNLSRTLWIGLRGGVAVGGELKLDAPDGTRLSQASFDTAGLIGGELHLAF